MQCCTGSPTLEARWLTCRRFSNGVGCFQSNGVGCFQVSGYVLGADEGDAYDFRGGRFVIKASGADTFGQLAVMESICPPGLSVPAHVHAGEDEMLYLLDGELTGFCDDDHWTATPGGFVFVPRDRPHGFVVTSEVPAWTLVIIGPPALDRQVATNGTPLLPGARGNSWAADRAASSRRLRHAGEHRPGGFVE